MYIVYYVSGLGNSTPVSNKMVISKFSNIFLCIMYQKWIKIIKLSCNLLTNWDFLWVSSDMSVPIAVYITYLGF